MAGRREPRDLAADLHARGLPTVAVAAVLRDRYGMNARVAMRLARGWSQADVAAAWCARWPADPKTFKNISYWENWPSPTGHAPSLAVLDRLAQLYGCDVADLLAGWGEYGPARTDQIPAEAETLAWQVRHLGLPELTRTIADWAARLPDGQRRNLLLKLSTAASFAASESTAGADRPRGRTGAAASQLTGRWASSYSYRSTSRDRELSGEHTVVFELSSGRLVGRSLPEASGSELTIRLTADGGILTGTWTEQTSPAGHYRAATYHGLIQLVVDPTGHAMRGMWLGAGKHYTIKSGTWRLDRQVDGSPDPVTTATTMVPGGNSPAATIAYNANSIFPT